jgi:hypothetical protein
VSDTHMLTAVYGTTTVDISTAVAYLPFQYGPNGPQPPYTATNNRTTSRYNGKVIIVSLLDATQYELVCTIPEYTCADYYTYPTVANFWQEQNGIWHEDGNWSGVRSYTAASMPDVTAVYAEEPEPTVYVLLPNVVVSTYQTISRSLTQHDAVVKTYRKNNVGTWVVHNSYTLPTWNGDGSTFMQMFGTSVTKKQAIKQHVQRWTSTKI